jgi:transposase
VNCGITNSETFCLFLVKLVEHLDGQDIRWRERSVIMLDNANYHRSVPTWRVMDELRLPVLYLRPYHFRLAPIEMLFNYVKNHDLNPLHSTLVTW